MATKRKSNWNTSKRAQQIRMNNPFGDFDRDKVPNYRDCQPFNPYEHGFLGNVFDIIKKPFETAYEAGQRTREYITPTKPYTPTTPTIPTPTTQKPTVSEKIKEVVTTPFTKAYEAGRETRGYVKAKSKVPKIKEVKDIATAEIKKIKIGAIPTISKIDVKLVKVGVPSLADIKEKIEPTKIHLKTAGDILEKGGKGWEEQIITPIVGKYEAYKKYEEKRIGISKIKLPPEKYKDIVPQKEYVSPFQKWEKGRLGKIFGEKIYEEYGGYDITPITLKKAGERYTGLVSEPVHTIIGSKKQKEIVEQQKKVTEAYKTSEKLIKSEWQVSGETILPKKLTTEATTTKNTIADLQKIGKNRGYERPDGKFEYPDTIEGRTWASKYKSAINKQKRYVTEEGYYKEKYIEYTPAAQKYVTAYETYETEQAKLEALPDPSGLRQLGMGFGTMLASLPGFVTFEVPRIAAETVIKPTVAPSKLVGFGVGMKEFAEEKPIEFIGSLAAMWSLGGFKTPYRRGKIAQPKIMKGEFPSGAKAYSLGILTKKGEGFFSEKPYQEFYPGATFTRGLPKIKTREPLEFGKPTTTEAKTVVDFAKKHDGYIAGSKGIYYQMPKGTVRVGADHDIYFMGKTLEQTRAMAKDLQTQLGKNYEVRLSKGGNPQIYNKVTGKQVVDMLRRKAVQDKIVIKDDIPLRDYKQILRDKRQIVKHVQKSDPKYSKAVADIAKTEKAVKKGEYIIRTERGGISFKRYPVKSYEQLFGKEKGQWLPETPFETKIVRRISGVEEPLIVEARGTRFFTIKSKVAAKEVRSGIIEILEREKVPNVNKVADVIIKDLKKYKAELYGSLIQELSGKAIGKVALDRIARDIDIHVTSTGYTILFKGKKYTSSLEPYLLKGHPPARNSIISGKTDRLQFHHIVTGKGETGVLMTYGEHLAIEVAMGHLGKAIGKNTLFHKLFRERTRITTKEIQDILKYGKSKKVQTEISNILKEVEKIDKKTPQFAEVVVQSINRAAGKKVIALKLDIHGNKTPTMIKSGEKLFDIHSKETPGYGYGEEFLGWGLKAEKMVTTKEKLKAITLSEQASRKFRGAVQVRKEPFYIIEGKDPKTGALVIKIKPERTIGKGYKIGDKIKEGTILREAGHLLPEHGGRFKDIADFYFAEKTNIAGLKMRNKIIDARKAGVRLEKWTDAWGVEIARRVRESYQEATVTGEKGFLGAFAEEAPVLGIRTIGEQIKAVSYPSAAIPSIAPSILPSTTSSILGIKSISYPSKSEIGSIVKPISSPKYPSIKYPKTKYTKYKYPSLKSPSISPFISPSKYYSPKYFYKSLSAAYKSLYKSLPISLSSFPKSKTPSPSVFPYSSISPYKYPSPYKLLSSPYKSPPSPYKYLSPYYPPKPLITPPPLIIPPYYPKLKKKKKRRKYKKPAYGWKVISPVVGFKEIFGDIPEVALNIKTIQ